MSGSFDPRITAYFGDAVLQAGFMPLPHLFLRHYRSLGLSQVQAMFVLQLMEIAWDVGDPPNSVNKLAARMGLSQRSIRACSKEVYDLGLVEIYDQWDEAGAQVENAYDLGPLFRRLAALAPAHTPPGQLRTRRQRSGMNDAPDEGESGFSMPAQSAKPTVELGRSTPVQKRASSPLQDSAPSPMQDFAGDGVQKRAAPHGTNDQPPREPAITGRVQKGSELKKETKNKPKKQAKKEQEHGGGVHVSLTNDGRHVGNSLRSNAAITAADARQSHAILDAAGLHGLVVERSSMALTPAECWSLVCYARGAALGPAWVASQVFDWSRRQPQAPQLNHRYDAVGQSLAALPLAQAQHIVDITDKHCPHAPDVWRGEVDATLDGLGANERAVCEAAHDMVWVVMAEQRPAPVAPAAPQPNAQQEASNPNIPPDTWTRVLDTLQHQIGSADWRSWIAPLHLLDIDGDTAVVGAPNVFVRNEASTTYAPRIADALQSALGRSVSIEYVIGTTVLA